jgi:hypothetical protein
LQPGVYNLSAEAPGFRKTVQNNIELASVGMLMVKVVVGQLPDVQHYRRSGAASDGL